MSVTMAAESRIGSRETQQDYYLYRDDGKTAFAVVCDGMGGLTGGEKASRAAAVRLKEDLKEALPISDIPAFFENEFPVLDREVYDLTNGDGTRIGAGTTLVSVMVEENRLYFFSVGDSRIFINRGDQMIALTREHNYRLTLDALRTVGKLTAEEYRAEENRAGQLISYIGMGRSGIFDHNKNPFYLEDNDRLLLCSDGVTKALTEEEIRETLSGAKTAEEIVKIFRKQIENKKKRYQDNATYLVILYREEDKHGLKAV